MKNILLFVLAILSVPTFAGPNYSSGKITSLMGSASDPAIRLQGNVSPDQCNGGTYGWLYFQGTPQEKQWIYSTALAMSLSGKTVAVYTNTNGETCRISNIQVTGGLN